jgi:hypothetical protein
MSFAYREWHLRSTHPTPCNGIDHLVGGQSGRSEPLFNTRALPL